ncbi:hypothetical protein NVT87_13650 [Acinetobacter radioresistens]|uniref:hypothetical protein n=1 Tax=Acinetobacter radioresistens TaxID=40216 RepID=UPI000DACEFD4|nr:hypothetical protein [Acinetobacter radioresistens]AWV86159.1 hypothetical protein DOM24_06050 [Acinetobacter radioresistens]MCK4091266.1 hypothetical protein [Acinetobacter radioresistens]MCK4100865.1 hypothetical protein [Acinetobacter radioresistens]MCX0327704.1 hypothetical protein [Acinetobacter radioresistens]MCX0331923.1 hypothetical protein [Acinetobacter radioresistens]
MTDKTLFLVQSDYSSTPQALSKLQKIYSPEDTIVLMGEAVLYFSIEWLKECTSLYILRTDTELLIEELPDFIDQIDYLKFADIILQFNRCIRLK